MSDDNFTALYNWMFDIGLSGNELIIYAYIYSFNKNGHCFYMSTQTLADKFHLRKQTIINILRSLVNKGYLYKQKHNKTNAYIVDKYQNKMLQRLQSDSIIELINGTESVPTNGTESVPTNGTKNVPTNGTKIIPSGTKNVPNKNNKNNSNKKNIYNFHQREYDFDDLEKQLLLSQ